MDAASSCSGDLSNPDSGKGASEEGDNAQGLPAEQGNPYCKVIQIDNNNGQ